MRAFKVLLDGRFGFTGWRWPLPDDHTPGEWVVASGGLELWVNGIHACTIHQLPQWLGEELWTIELDGGDRPDRRGARRESTAAG